MKLLVVAATLVLGASACAVHSTPLEVGGDVRAAVSVKAPAPSPSLHTAVRDPAAISATLTGLADAFKKADPDAVRPWLADPESPFGRRWLDRASNLAAVPLSEYRLEIEESLPDLATASVRAAYPDPVQVVPVRELHALSGFDANGPAEEYLFLTFVQRDERWLVASDSEAEALGLVTVRHLWDQGPVQVSGSGDVVALHHPGTPNVDAVVAEAADAIQEVQERWPLSWSGRVPIIVPSSQAELGQLLNVTFDLSTFVAFATATPTGELGAYELTGARVVVNPDRFLDRSSASRQLTLLHELTHVATRPSAGPHVPSWLEEGIAQVFGEQRSTTGTRLLDALVRDGFDGTLPRASQFTTGGRDRIFLSYQLSWSFVSWLVERFGRDTVGTFYATVGAGAGRPGTEPWHIDAAARETFGQPLAELARVWAGSL